MRLIAELAFDPTSLIDGIELSDDPLPMLRSCVYVYSVAGRQKEISRATSDAGCR